MRALLDKGWLSDHNCWNDIATPPQQDSESVPDNRHQKQISPSSLTVESMNDQNIKPEKITKPMQLLAAWLAGLLAIDSCFLLTASHLPHGSWESGALTIAAIINVPLFLGAVFLLQTKFRPELQEDSYYSTYLSRKTNELVPLPAERAAMMKLRKEIASLERAAVEAPGAGQSPIAALTIGINKHLNDKELIQRKLAELGVMGTTSFGGDESPSARVVAISQYLSDDTFRDAVRLAKSLGFCRYSRFDNRQEDAEEDILIGSYGNGEFEILP